MAHLTPAGDEIADSPPLFHLKRQAEEHFPDFPSIDINSPDFSPSDYHKAVTSLFHALNAPRDVLAITWSNLSCTVPVQKPRISLHAIASHLSTLTSVIRHGGTGHIRKDATATRSPQEDAPKKVNVLDGASGVVEPGEMCLVLGPSGSGASLLLSRIAGRPTGTAVENHGQVLYNGREKLGGIVNPTHYIQYVGQHDHHLAPITVRDTLEFAADCKWPEWMPHVDVIRRNDVILTARMLGIERTLDTVVGNDTIRGVSGGEKKRVTIAEMLIGLGARSVVMDNWSKGLDAMTALSIIRSMREFAKSQESPVITSMQAPGMDAFNQFDTICVLDRGQVLYFGPRDKVEEWFTSLGFIRPPQRSIPDFVATIANPDMRAEYLPSHVDVSGLEQPPPVSPEEFAQRFAKSSFAADVKERIEYVNTEHSKNTFTVPRALYKVAQKQNLHKTRFQIRALGRRQWRLLGATRNAVLGDIVQNLILGLILGSIFWQLPNNKGGADSRSGILFLSFLFIALSALSRIGERHEQKTVFAKQRFSSFYNAWPFIFTLFLFDFVVELVRAICFLVPLYLMAGLNLGSSAQRLLYAVLIVTMLSLIMTALTRFLVALTDDPNAAGGLGGILTIIMVLFAGFMKRADEIDPWLKWIYWADPLHYVYEALAINEYDGLTFECRQDELLPPVPDIPPDSRFCPVSTGKAYLENDLGIFADPIYRLYFFIVLVGYLALFAVVSAVMTALAKPAGHPLKLTSKPEVPDLDPDLTSTMTAIDIRNEGADEKANARFTFSNVKYTVNHGKKALLQGISGHAVSGKVILLMGESGAGKSTLLDVCALRKTLKKGTAMESDIRINSVLVNKDLVSHFTGYCEQTDLHVGEATVAEAVQFSAKLRLPASISDREKNVRAMETIDLLGLTPHSDVLVKALGSGELKLLTMALEVVADPLVLFLDEPTSGVSSSSALVVANALRRIADTGSCVICTLHQPSKEVFSMFDKLLLLKRGGKQVYFGDIGTNGTAIRNYFQSRGAKPMLEDSNPADWMLEVISDEKVDWVEEWVTSREKKEMEKEIEGFVESSSDEGKDGLELFKRAGLLTQMRVVIRRLFLRYWRLPEYNFTRVILMLVIALIIGLLFLRDINQTQAGALLAFSTLFLTVIPSSLSAQNVILPTVQGRTVFYREVASGTYKPFAFHAALGIVEIPFTVFATTIFAVIFYFMVGLDPSRFGYFFLALQLLYFYAVMLGVMLASITPNDALAGTIASSLTAVFNVLSGFFIRKDDMPVWWRWTTWINPMFYYLSGLVQNQMSGQEFTCEPSERVPFQLPPNVSSCFEINIPGVDTATINGETTCTFCPIPNGQALIEQFGANDVNRWASIGALVAFIFVCRIIAGIGFSRLRFLSR